MKNIKNWKEIKRNEAADGSVQVIYELNGYHIIVSDASYLPGGYSISAEAIDRDSYLPCIYVSSAFGQPVQTISVQTTSWGALEISEIDKVVEAYKAAQTVAHEIEKAFPECFNEKTETKEIKVEWCENFIKAQFARIPFEHGGIHVGLFWNLAERSGLWERGTYGSPMSEALGNLTTVEAVNGPDGEFSYNVFRLKDSSCITKLDRARHGVTKLFD